MTTLILPEINIPEQATQTPFGRVIVPGVHLAAKTVNVDWAQINNLRQAAREAVKNAYTPYAVQFPVGCALIMADDAAQTIFTASNVENGVWNSGVCAERATLHYAVGQGFTKLKLLALSTPRLTDVINFRSPCGICRQTISEFADSNTLIIIDKDMSGDACDIVDIDRLLPYRYLFEG